MEVKEVEIVSSNRFFKILDYKFMIANQLNKNLNLKYCIDLYDEDKKYYKTIGYCNTVKEGKIKSLKYLANIL